MADVSDYPESVVVDASFILTRLLPDEKVSKRFAPYFQRFTKGTLQFSAPRLLRYEVANALRSAILQRRVEDTVAEKLLVNFLKLPIHYKEENFVEAFKVALELKINIYDAVYIWLARKERIPLLTLDANLTRAVELRKH